MKSNQKQKPLSSVQVGANIRRIRRQAHLSQQDLAKQLGMRQGPVSNLENGKNLPSATVLVRLARILRVSTDEILCGSAYAAACGGEGHRLVRTHPIEESKLTKKHRAAIEEVIEDYLALEDICRVPRKARIPLCLPLEETLAGAERMAAQMRALMGIESAVVFDLLELFENHGMRVVFMDLPERVPRIAHHDAMNENVFIFIRSGNSPEKQIFDLVYGLGRILLYNNALANDKDPMAGESKKDKWARHFAACFLLPSQVVRNSVAQVGVFPKEWDYNLLLRLKHRFGVSAQSFNYRIKELSLIDDAVQIKLQQKIDAYYAAHKKREPGDSCRILSINGRLGDLCHTALRRKHPEATAISRRLPRIKRKPK